MVLVAFVGFPLEFVILSSLCHELFTRRSEADSTCEADVSEEGPLFQEQVVAAFAHQVEHLPGNAPSFASTGSHQSWKQGAFPSNYHLSMLPCQL